MTFTGYRPIRCFCATTSHDLVTLTFDLLTLRVCHVQCFSCLTHIPIFIILWLSVTELRVLNIWSHFRYLKQSLRMPRVMLPLTGGKNSPHFWNPWPQFAYSLCHFHGATTKIKPCYPPETRGLHNYSIWNSVWYVNLHQTNTKLSAFFLQSSLSTQKLVSILMDNRFQCLDQKNSRHC